MSILLNALNKAAADREAARLARARTPENGGRPDQVPIPPADMTVGEMARQAPNTSMHEATIDAGIVSVKPMPAIRGLWITLALAVVSSTLFGFWVRGLPSMRPQTTPAEAMTSLASTATPRALLGAPEVDEATPLQLRLDRRLDSLATHTR